MPFCCCTSNNMPHHHHCHVVYVFIIVGNEPEAVKFGPKTLAETIDELDAINKGLVKYDPNNDPFNGLSKTLFPFLTVYEFTEDKPLNDNIILPHLPTELVTEISRHLSTPDMSALRSSSKRFRYAVKTIFGKALVNSQILFPTYSSLSSFLALLRSEPFFPHMVETVTLVGEAPRVHEHGAEWAWERLQDKEGAVITKEDVKIVEEINAQHGEWCKVNDAFCTGGGYRVLLTMVLLRLPNLKKIKIRNLYPGEHIPDVDGMDSIKDLSFYREGLPTNDIFYGDYQYDTIHKRVTVYTDEYGDEIVEPGAGPQARFIDDVIAATRASGLRVKFDVK